MIFSDVKSLVIPEGVVTKIMSGALVLWQVAKEGLEYCGTITALSTARRTLAAVHVGNYALFGGGQPPAGASNVVDAYDVSLTRTKPTALSTARYALAATSVGKYALFGGGCEANDSAFSIVDVYDESLTCTTTNNLASPRDDLAAATVGDHALFAGGGKTGVQIAYSYVDAYAV